MIWKPLFDSDDPLEDHIYMCSNCGECISTDDDYTFWEWKYCPFCGEKDEEKKEEIEDGLV